MLLIDFSIWTYLPREETETMMILLTIQSIPCYKPIHLESGRKHTSICLNLILFTDINLFTSRGDGNLSVPCINIHWVFWYKPIYLERERKLKGWLHISIYRTILIQTYIPREGTETTSPSFVTGCHWDINLYTSRGDFFENFENSLDTASRKC